MASLGNTAFRTPSSLGQWILLERISKEDQFKAPVRARSLSLGRHFAYRVGFVSTHQGARDTAVLIKVTHNIIQHSPRLTDKKSTISIITNTECPKS